MVEGGVPQDNEEEGGGHRPRSVKPGVDPERVHLLGRPCDEGAQRSLCTPGKFVRQDFQCQVDIQNNYDFMMAWLPLFATNEPTELEVKRALIATHEAQKLCPAGQDVQERNVLEFCFAKCSQAGVGRYGGEPSQGSLQQAAEELRAHGESKVGCEGSVPAPV